MCGKKLVSKGSLCKHKQICAVAHGGPLPRFPCDYSNCKMTFVSIKTKKLHIKNIHKKIGVSRRALGQAFRKRRQH